MSTIRQYCDAPIFFGGNGPGDDNATVKADRRLPSVTVQVQHMEAGSEMEPAYFLWLLQERLACLASFSDRSTHPNLFSLFLLL